VRLAEAGVREGAAGLVQALVGATCAAAALGSDAKIAAQVLEGARAIAGSLMDLAFGHGVADTDVHGLN